MYLCIPRVSETTKKDFICNRLCNLGSIERISEFPLKNDPTHKRIIFKMKWNNNETSKRAQNYLSNNSSINIVYDIPWFWKVVVTNQRI
jgi:hypothetical protein